MDRRTYLATAAAAASIGLAGCSGDGGDGSDGADGGDGSSGGGDGDDGTEEPTETPTETDSPTPEPGFTQAWQTSLGEFRVSGNGFNGAFAGGRLFVSIAGQGLFALDAADGSVLWEHTEAYGYGDVEATADYAFVTFEGGMAAFSAESGEEAWRTSTEGGSLLATTGDLVVRDGGGFDPAPVYDAASGEELRTLENAGGYHMLADASTGRLYSGAGANTRAYDLATGEEAWRTRRPLSRQPAIVGDTLVKATDGTFVLYDGESGTATEVTAGNVGGPTVGAAGVAVAIDSNASTVYGLDPEAGSVAWTTEITDPGFTAPTTVGSQVVIPAGEGLVGMNASSGEVTDETDVQGLSAAGLVGGDSQVFRVFGDAGEAVVVGYSTPAAE